MELRDRVVVVTGASSGIGRRLALELATAGAIVVGFARRADLLAVLQQELQRTSPRSRTQVCDVTGTEAFIAALGEVATEHGRIDVLINNAGVGEPRADPLALTDFRAVMDTNYFAAVAGTMAVLPDMQSRGCGVVVNVSSDSGRAPGPADLAYGPTKAALSAFTESMAMRVASTGVHLHILYPGWVPTAMGSEAVDAGMPRPPRMVRRTEEQVAKLVLARMGGRRVDIDAAPVARLAPVARALFPGLYRRGVERASR